MTIKRIMREFSMDEISAVDRPAQEGARALIAKRHTPGQDDMVEKDAHLSIMTAKDESGHQHLVWVCAGSRGGETGHGKSMGEAHGHGHPWTLDPVTGALVIGENHGHSHSVDARLIIDVLLALSKAAAPTNSEGNQDMNELELAKVEIATLTGRLAAAERLAELTDAQKGHLSKLSKSEGETFLKLDRVGRDEAVAKAAAADPVVFKSEAGVEYRKSDDPRLVDLAKERDADRKLLRESREAAAQAGYEKRADSELGHLPGTVQERAALIRAVDGIQDQPQREAALKALKAGSDALAKGFQRTGTRGGETATLPGSSDRAGAEQRLDELAKSFATANKVSFEQAYSKVLDTPEGAQLYRQTIPN